MKEKTSKMWWLLNLLQNRLLKRPTENETLIDLNTFPNVWGFGVLGFRVRVRVRDGNRKRKLPWDLKWV